ncbi:hypothetical protein [Streptomyces sp. NPDC058486]|uniref:hypothetical protein n=1 Tax=unclassified Streptomyces TaxID=2593676 RepID=UPI00364F4F13
MGTDASSEDAARTEGELATGVLPRPAEPGILRTAHAITAALSPGRKGRLLAELLGAPAGDEQSAVRDRRHLRAVADGRRTDVDRAQAAALRTGERGGMRPLGDVVASLGGAR